MAGYSSTPAEQEISDTFNRKVAELSAARERIQASYYKFTPTPTSHAAIDVSPSMGSFKNVRTPEQDAAYAQADAIVKQHEADKTDGSGFLTTANLNSANPFVSLPTNAINAAALAMGGLAKISTNTAALIADDLPRIYQSIGTPTPVADAYNRYVASNDQRNALGQQAAQVDRLLAKGTINPVEAAARKVELQTKAKGLVTSDEDWALLNQRNSLTTSDSYLEQLDKAQLNIQEGKVRRGQVEGDPTSDAIAAIRNLGNRNAYRSISEVNKGNEEIAALDATADQQYADGNWIRATGNRALATGKGALNVIGAGIKNPLGALNLAAEMAPQLINPYVTLASSAGATGEQNLNSLEQYQKREGKTVASQGEGLAMLGLSVGYGVMDAVSDHLMAKGFQGQTNATRALADVVPKTTAKAALGIITKPVTKTLQAAIPEAITEGAQTAIEDSYGSLGTTYDSASVGTGAGLGALVSGTLQGKNTIKAGLQEGALDLMLARPKGLEAIERAKQRQATDAIPTEELTDITHPNYNPTAAVQRFGKELTQDTTPEQAVAIKTRINEVTSKMETSIEKLQSAITSYPEELAKLERNKPKYDAYLEHFKDDPEQLANIKGIIADRQAQFDAQFGGMDLDQMKTTLKTVQQQLLQTDQFASSFNTIIDSRFPDAVNAPKQAQNAPVSDSVDPVVQTPVDQSNVVPVSTTEQSPVDTNAVPTTVTDQSVDDISTTEPVQQSKKDFDDIVSSYPSESTSIAASKLADDTSNDLTDTQRTTLRKLSDAIVVANRTKTLGDVSKDVIEGSKGYRGLNQYISSMMNAVRAGKKAVQGALVSDINSFNEDHAQKAQLARQAMSMAPKGMAQEVLRTKSGWELGKQIPISQAMSKKYQAEMHKSGSLAIHSGSETIVKGIEDESSAISVVADILKAIQESQSTPKQPSKAQEDTLEQELEQLTGKKIVVPTEASKPVTTTDTTNPVEQTPTEVVNTKEQAAVTKAEPRVEAKPVTGNLQIPEYTINRNLVNKDGSKLIASTNGTTIQINPVDSVQEFFDYFEGKFDSQSSKQKQQVLSELAKQGYSLDRIKSILSTKKLVNTFLVLHEQDHIDNNDRDVYWLNGKDLLTPDKVAMEVRASINPLKAIEASLGFKAEPVKKEPNISPTQISDEIIHAFSVEHLSQLFKESGGKPLELVYSGFVPKEVLELQLAGLSNSKGFMTKEMFNTFSDEYSRRSGVYLSKEGSSKIGDTSVVGTDYYGIPLNTEVTVADIVGKIPVVHSDPTYVKYITGLFSTLAKMVPDYRVQFFTDLSSIKDVEARKHLTSDVDIKGTNDGDNKIVYIRMDGRSDIKINEVIVHELRHAVTALAVIELDKEENADIKDTIENVQEVVREYLNSNPEAYKTGGNIAYALSNIDEFIAVGTTDYDTMNLLKKIKITPTRTALQVLLTSLGRLFGLSGKDLNVYTSLQAITKYLEDKQLDLITTNLNQPSPQEALDQFNEQDRAERQAKNETRQIKEVGKVNEAKISQDESVPVEDTPVITVEDSADIQPEVVNTEAIEPVVEAKSVKGITAIQATKEERAQLREEMKVDNGKTTTGYQKVNLVKALFTQKASSVLAVVKDLLSTTTDKGIELMTGVLGTAPTTKQQELFDVFTLFAKHQQKSYRELMNNRANEVNKKGESSTGEFNFKDYLQFLYEGKAEQMEENITTAASVAAFGWLVENGKKFRLDSDGVKALLGEPNAPNLPYSTYSRFSTIGSQRGNVIRSLGSRVYEALGMSVAKDVDAAHKDRFINALGSMVLQTLIDQNLVQLTPIPKAELKAAIRSLTGETLPSIEDLELAAANGGQKEAEALAKRIKSDKAEALEINYFIRAAHKTEVVDGKENSLGVSKLIDTLIEANKGTDGLMSKLFGVTSREIAPLLKKPTTFAQAVIDDAGTEVAGHLAENVLKASQTAYGVSNLNSVYGNLHDSHREQLLGMLGYKSDAQLADMHVSNRESAEAVNESILRSLDNAFDTIGSLRLGESDNYSNFYLPMKIWAVNRVGVMSNMLNEQGDKIHRSLVHVAAHKQEVTIGESFVDGKITQFGKFLLAVAGGMEGTKSIVGFTSDKTTAGEFIPRFEAYLATPKVQTAIAAMQAIKSGKYSDGDVALVAEIIQEFGMSPMSMAALNALAEYQSGKDSGGVFTTDVSLESDGVTSGSAISLLVYGVTDQTKLAAAGFYTEGDDTPNISTYRAEGKKDLYLQLADQMKAQWQALVLDRTIPPTIVSTFAFFDRAFGTREGAKGVQTPLIYGSGFNAINAANTSALVQSIYNRLQEIALMPDQVRTEALKTFVGHYNQLAKAAGFPTKVESLFTGMTKEELLAFEMDSTSIKLLGEYNATTRGKAIKAAVENVVGDMLAVRTNLFAATGAGFTVYNALFKAVYADTVAELKAKGELLVRTDRLGREIPFEDLSPDQLQGVFDKLSEYDSRVNTADGVVSDNTKASAMPTYNVTKEVIEADPLNPGIEAQYKSEHKFKRAPYVTDSTFTLGSIRSLTTTNKDGDTKYIQVGKSESIATYSRKTVLESKGASVSATLIQGIDAFVSAMTQALHRAAGHHDANTGSIDDAEFMAQTQNKVLMDAVIKTHINSNAIDAVLNPLLGIISKEHSHLFTREAVYAIRREALKSINLGRAYGEKYPSLEVALKSMIKTAYKADLAKLTVIDKLATVSQYSLEGGQVKLSQEQRDTIAKEREALRTKYTSVMESVDVINKGINNFKPSPKPVMVAPVVQPTSVEPPVTVVTQQTTTEQFLSNYDGGLIPHKELFDHLRSEFKGKKGWYTAGQRTLLELVAKVLPTDLPINVVTALSAPKDTRWYQGNPNHESRAWASTDHVVYRLDRDTINPEVVLHELVHAITLGGLRNTVNGSVVKQLQELSDIAKAQYDSIKDKSIYTEAQQAVFKEAFSDLNEFVSIAMSNRDMQNFLDRIIIPRTEAKPGLATMFQKFIKSIGSILNKAAGRTTPLDSNTQSVLEATIYNTTQVIQTQFNNAQNQGFDLQSSYPHEQAKSDALKRATQYTAREVFNVLDGSGISNEFNAHLAGVIATVVDNSFSVLEAHDLTGSDTAGYTPYQVWNEKLSQGKVPYASTAMATGFNLSEKELFAVEAIEASLNAAMNNGVGTAVHKELKAAFLKARESLKDERVFFAGDWSKASQQQRDQALAKYNLVFKLVGNTNKQEENAYLSRFAALALGSQEFSALLDFPVYTQENRGDKSLSSAISNYFDTAMQWVNGYLSKTVSNQTIKDKLPILAQQLIEIDHKKRDAALPGILDKLHTAQEIGNEVIQDASEKLADKLKGVRGTKVVQTVLKGNVMDNLDVLKDARNKENPNSVLGVAAELLSELANANTAQQGMQKFFRKHEVVQNTRKSMIASMTKNVLNTFIDGGKNLKQNQLEAVTYGLLRTNAQALLSTYGVRGIQDFVGDTVKRNAEIVKLEAQLNDPLLLNRTKDLAWYMVSGEGCTGLAKNTTSILRGVGTKTVVDETKIDPVKLDLLDKLNALYAIEYTRKDHQEDLKQLITDELSRKGQSGIESTLAYHRGLVEDSKNTLFEGNSVSRIQGWLPEIVNPHREVAIATNEADAKELERLGFHLHSQPKTDPNDPVSGIRKVYMTEESTKTRFTTGALSLTTTARKGTSVFTGSDVKGKAAYQAIDKMGKGTAAHLAAHTKAGYDPRKGNTSMIPTYANDGSIIDYNYEMTHESRDSLLQRNNNFAAVLGSYAGTNYDKLESPKHNDVVLKAIHDQFLEGYAASPEAYVEISPHANDPRLREIYAMLPHDAKQTMEKLWGKGEPMMIRNDLLLSTFGAHKLTIGSAFDKNPDQRNMIENTVVSTLEAMFGDTAKLKGLRAERAWQEVALTMKSFVVIRNVKTLLGNQMSNMGVLMAMGVNPIDVYQDSAIALKGALQYRKDTAIIINANQQLRAGLGIPSEHHQDILRAQDSLARNPVRDFIAAGMLTSIVEDISLEEDPYSYKSKYAQRLDEMTGGVPDGVKTALSYAFVSPKTPLYQLLADATQFSDFTAKYVLYKNSTTKAKKKLSHDEAINLADKMFINYGVPTSPELQYMNDMGFLMFTKYTLRIQRAMAYLLKEHPAGTLGEVLISSQLGSVSVLDPLFLNNIGNPLRTGALGMPSVIDEPFPVAMLKGLLF